MTALVRVHLPQGLRDLARTGAELRLHVPPPVTAAAILDALEAAQPTLRGTIRDRATGARRPFLRFFAVEQDLSHQPMDRPLPAAIAEGTEPFLIVGAIAGG
jgi:sulfur-carrier protein